MRVKLSFESLIYLAGFLLTVVELIFHLQGKSVCASEGCRVVESFVKGGNIVLIIAGTLFFGFLFLLKAIKLENFIFDKERYKKTIEWIYSTVLIVALTVEGYFVGFQAFIIKEFCPFCLTVFSIIVMACLYRLFVKERHEVAFAFVCFIAVFLATYVVNPALNPMPKSERILIYSEKCPHCESVINFCKEINVDVATVEAEKVAGIIKSLNINQVPVLICDCNSEKKILIGEDKIKNYLISKLNSENDQKTEVKVNSKNLENLNVRKISRISKIEKTEEKQTTSNQERQTQEHKEDAGFCPVFKTENSEKCK